MRRGAYSCTILNFRKSRGHITTSKQSKGKGKKTRTPHIQYAQVYPEKTSPEQEEGIWDGWRGRLGQHLTRRRAGAADVATLRRQQHELDEDVVVVHEHRDVDEEDVAGGVDERRRRSGTERNDGGERRCGRGCDGVEMSDCRAPRDGWQVQHAHAGSGDYGEG